MRRRATAGLASISLCLVALTGPAFAQGQNPLLPKNLSPWGMFLNADIVVKAVMIGLAFASLVTWTVWLAKTLELNGKQRLARRRIKLLERGGDLMDTAHACRGDRDAVAQLILSAAREADLSGGIIDDGFKEARRIAAGAGGSRDDAADVRAAPACLRPSAPTAPFVGLFGTVWGIMNAFIGISESHTTNLAVVAPGIAEALLATAMGLVAAIPAVVIYNHLARVIGGYRALLATPRRNCC